MITSENGFFPIVTFDRSDSWPTLLKVAGRHLDQRGLCRLSQVLGDKCQCVVVEREYIDRDFRDTFSHFHSKRFSTPLSRCVRMHFFSKPMTEAEIASGNEEVQNAYLGYSVIRPTKPNCVGRTLLAHSLRLHIGAHLATCEEKVHLLGTRLVVEDFPFISQDGDATVCAESALWMLFRYYSNRYALYSEILPFQITKLAHHHAAGRRIYPSAGLYSWQLAEALRLQQFSPIVYSRDQFPGSFDHFLYTYIESGLPVLATLPGHVVVLYGHASEYTVPAPTVDKQFIYSSHFNRSFVISDDNCFPYQILLAMGPNAREESQYYGGMIDQFIVPLPEKVFLTAEQAQTAIEAVLNSPRVGLSTSPTLTGKSLVFRLFLTSARSLKGKLRKRGMGNELVERIYRALPMPHFVWICEIAECCGYAVEKKILGEVIWDATRNAHEPDGWIACHLPESLAVDLGSALNCPQQLQTYPLSTHNSYSLLESNLHSLS